MAANDTADVSNVKGVRGGYGYSAPAGTTVGTEQDPFAALGTEFKNMGFISEDGIEEEIDTDTEEVHDLNGEVICVLKSQETETLTLTLVSITADSLAEWHGHGAVSESSNVITVKHANIDHDIRCYVFELLLKDGRKWRKVVPNGQVTEVGSIVHGSGEVAGREITITCMPDADGFRMYDYIQKTATTTTTTGE